jgi:energy-coupling factor transporter ATP-binding protein EcfA2
MTINLLIKQELFDMYTEINTKVQQIQKSEKKIEEKRNLMKVLRQEYEIQANNYNQIAIQFAKNFIKHHRLSDYAIEAKIGSPTTYGNQPKPYLWSGISIDREKSYSFQYSWVFNHQALEVTFCFGSGGSSSGKIEKSIRNEREGKMRSLESRFLQIISIPTNKLILDRLLDQEGFVLTAEWLDSGNKGIKSIEQFIDKIKGETGAKSGITRFFSQDELLAEGFDLEKRINSYFEHFRPIWDQLHEVVPISIISPDKIINIIEEVPLSVKEQLDAINSYIKQRGFTFPSNLIENLFLSLRSKPFVILAGVSGTGKTKLVKLFAEALGATRDNNQFVLIPVRPDWSDPSDLLGYKDLTGAFRPGRLSEVLVEASKESNRHKPYFICLDEMNLARVEHYFSDLLSVIETQEWKNDRIVTHPLIQSNSLSADDKSVYGNLSLPDNVYLLGTVNMDETTHPFSKKVLDRANTIEFNVINLEQYPEELNNIAEVSVIPAPNSFLRSEYIQLVDVYKEERELIESATKKLVNINGILEHIHSQVGFRIRDAICFYMAYNKRFQLMSDDDAFDLQLLQKILPRVQGSSSSVKRVLLQLMQEALGRTIPIGDYLDDANDLYKKWVTSDLSEAAKYPQSARKIAFMIRRLEEDGFTSYWLS